MEHTGLSRNRGRRWWQALVAIPTLGLGLFSGTWLIAYLALHPSTRVAEGLPSEAPSLVYEEVHFTTTDGLMLRGWYLPGRSDATVILIHGFARDRSELLPEARWLVAKGYSALLFDSRAQGQSEGDHISFGQLERLDVTAAVEFCLNRSPRERIGVMGYSMGAVAAIRAAATDPRIQAIIAISPFASLRDTMELRLRPFQFLAPLTIWWGERMTGLRLDDLRPVEAIASVSPRPILIMQAGDDQVVPPNSGQKLYSAAGRPKDLWLAPGVEHVNFRESLPEAYRERIIGFFERYLPLGGREKEPG